MHNWLTLIAASLSGPEPRAYWYLSRAAGLTAYGLLWLAIVLGLSLSNRLARVWPGGPTAADLHQFASLLALVFATVHGLVLVGDQYIGYTFAQILVPFAGTAYRPLWVGLGQVGFYLAVVVAFSVYVRDSIGYRTWRTLHYLSFAVYILATLHALGAGTDSASPQAFFIYWAGAVVVGLLTVRRFLAGGPRSAGAHG